MNYYERRIEAFKRIKAMKRQKIGNERIVFNLMTTLGLGKRTVEECIEILEQ